LDKRQAARVLGISLASLYRKLHGRPDDSPRTEQMPPDSTPS